jgi:ribonuclease HII
VCPTKNLSLFPEDVLTQENDPFFHESLARKAGYGLVAGVDEAGRGPLAGPVVAAAVILPQGVELPGIRDSKKMTAQAREEAFSVIHREATTASVGVLSSSYIDESNILKASLEAMARAISALEPQPELLLIDGIHPVPVPIPQKCLKRGDQISRTISAASVVAKVYRDRIMCSYHRMYPVYQFDKNKGYGTPRHLEALKRYGPCPIHRVTFRGVSGFDQAEA